MKKLLLFAVTITMAVSGCKKDDADNNSDSGKLPPLPDKTDVCSAMDDITFMNYCYENFDVNKDGKISKSEYNAVKEINCDGLQITSFKGIEYFANLETFSCKKNGQIEVIDLSHNKNITTIGELAFYECVGLINIAIPDGVTSIGGFAFYGCTGLTSVTIPDSVTTIGDAAFRNCTELTRIVIGNGVTAIAQNAFQNCSKNLESIYGKFASDDNRCLIFNEKLLCFACVGITEYTIPCNVTTIGDYAFNGCTGLTNVTIGDGVTTIGDYAFNGCTGLTNVTIGNGVTTIGDAAFKNCTELTSITIPDSVKTIGKLAFYGCTGITSVTIGNSITTIGRSAFYGCTGLTSITIPDSVTTISDYAFIGCTKLTGFYGKYASEDKRCLVVGGKQIAFAPAGLTEYTIPDGITEIGKHVFFDSQLNSVTIPNSVTIIGYCAFYKCWLWSLYCKAVIPPSLDSTAFKNIPSYCKIYVHRSSVDAYKSAEGWKEYASQIVGYDF